MIVSARLHTGSPKINQTPRKRRRLPVTSLRHIVFNDLPVEPFLPVPYSHQEGAATEAPASSLTIEYPRTRTASKGIPRGHLRIFSREGGQLGVKKVEKALGSRK